VLFVGFRPSFTGRCSGACGSACWSGLVHDRKFVNVKAFGWGDLAVLFFSYIFFFDSLPAASFT